MQTTPVLVTLTGRDRPGVTAAFFASLAAHDLDVRDVEQLVIRDRLILAVLLDLQGETGPLRASVSRTAHALGMEAEVVLAGQAQLAVDPGVSRNHVTVMGHPLRPGAISAIAQRIADLGGNIESIAQLSVEASSAIEIVVTVVDAPRLRQTLVLAGQEAGVDVAIEPSELRRQPKRLIVLDIDSTLVQQDGLDVLAEAAGVSPAVAAIAARMNAGELDYEQSVRSRVQLLRGLPVGEVQAAADQMRLASGAGPLVGALRRLGYYVGIVSSGFTVFTDRFVAELGLDFAAANILEVEAGVLTGRLAGTVVDRVAKAEALRRFAAACAVPLAQTVAIGTGDTDIDMLEVAALGIAFNAKAALRAADAAAPRLYLDSVLFVLGIAGHELPEPQRLAGLAG
jgi:phosphoserine phosphatase